MIIFYCRINQIA